MRQWRHLEQSLLYKLPYNLLLFCLMGCHCSCNPLSCKLPPLYSQVFFARPSGIVPTVPVAGCVLFVSATTPTILVDVPSHQETKGAFAEVSSAFKGMTKRNGQVQGDLQVLASVVVALKQV